MSHPIIGLFIQGVLAALGFDLWVGVIAATCFFVSREYTQAEYRWIEHYGGGRRANMGWRDPFSPKVWNVKSITDMLYPAAVTSLVALLARWV